MWKQRSSWKPKGSMAIASLYIYLWCIFTIYCRYWCLNFLFQINFAHLVKIACSRIVYHLSVYNQLDKYSAIIAEPDMANIIQLDQWSKKLDFPFNYKDLFIKLSCRPCSCAFSHTTEQKPVITYTYTLCIHAPNKSFTVVQRTPHHRELALLLRFVCVSVCAHSHTGWGL